jgi:hypothetical protein
MIALTPPGAPKLIGRVNTETGVLVVDAAVPADWQSASAEDVFTDSTREVPSITTGIPADRPGGDVNIGGDPGLLWRARGTVHVFRVAPTVLTLLVTETGEDEVILDLAKRPIEKGERFGTFEVKTGKLVILPNHALSTDRDRVSALMDDGSYACVADRAESGEVDASRCHLIKIDDPAQAKLFSEDQGGR